MKHRNTSRFWGRGRALALTCCLALGLALGFELMQPSSVEGGPSGGTAAGGSTPSQLAQYLPDDTLFLIEAPQLWSIGSSMSSFNYMNADELGPLQFVDKIEKAISEAYGISAKDAEMVIASLNAAAMAGRSPRLAGSGDEEVEAVGLIHFSDASAGSMLVATDRFTKGKAIGNSGFFYNVEEDYELEGMASGLGRMNTSDDEDESFAWFPGVGIAAYGHENMIESIGATIDSGSKSLLSNAAFQTANSDYDPNALLIGFVDTAEFKNAEMIGVYIEQIFGSAEPTSFSMHATPFGFKTQMTSRLQGAFVPPQDLAANKLELTLASKLPASTLFYASGGAQYNISGDEYVELYFDYLTGVADFLYAQVPEGDAFSMERMIASAVDGIIEEGKNFQDKYGLKTDDVFKGFGDEFCIAWVVPSDLHDLLVSPDTILDETAIIMLMEVGDIEAFERVVKGYNKLLKDQSGFEVQKTESGWKVDLEMFGLPSVKIEYLMDQSYALVSFGSASAVSSVEDSLAGKTKTLGEDPAYIRARQTVSATAHGQMWFDSGRFLEAGMGHMSDEEKAMMKEEVGFSPDIFRMSGVDRPTTMASFSIDFASDDTWTTHFEATNLFMAFGALGATFAIMEPWAAMHDEMNAPVREKKAEPIR